MGATPYVEGLLVLFASEDCSVCLRVFQAVVMLQNELGSPCNR